MKKKVVAIIPVRGGSKGIPQKNLTKLGGRTLIEWTLDLLLESTCIDDIVFTSDDPQILNFLKSFPVIGVKRPDEYATDTASSESAIKHALEALPYLPETVIFPQVTSPFRPSGIFDKAYHFFVEKNFDSMLSVVENDYFIWREAPEIMPLNYDYRNRPMRQSRPKEWIENGSFYIFKSAEFLKENNRLFGKIGLYPMHNPGAMIDINTHQDLSLAEKYLQNESALT